MIDSWVKCLIQYAVMQGCVRLAAAHCVEMHLGGRYYVWAAALGGSRCDR